MNIFMAAPADGAEIKEFLLRCPFRRAGPAAGRIARVVDLQLAAIAATLADAIGATQHTASLFFPRFAAEIFSVENVPLGAVRLALPLAAVLFFLILSVARG